MAVVTDSVPAVPATASSLAPGFRFHPTDEELVRYYLRRKICGKPFRFDAISDVDVYKVEPWDLPGLSRLKTRDLEWYFFSVLDKKYGNGSRTNRATDRGYWKTTGKDRSVYHRSQLVGMKKTLVYHSGRAPKGQRTNWVMHEYRLIDQDVEKAGFVQDAFVLCRIFRKSGAGPKNGEQYGAPFVEEEWEDDELVMVPKQESAEELAIDDDDAYLDANDLEQILGSDTLAEDSPPPLDFHQHDDVSSAEASTEGYDNPQDLLVEGGEDQPQANNEDTPKLFDLPVENGMDPKSVKHEYIGETSNSIDYDVDYLLDEPFFDASINDFQFDGSSFLEADNLKNNVNKGSGLDMFDEYTSYFNQEMDSLEYTFDSTGIESILCESSSLTLEDVNEETCQISEVRQNDGIAYSKLEEHNNNGASSSNQEDPDSLTGSGEGSHDTNETNQQMFEEQSKDLSTSSNQEDPDFSTDFAYPFLQRASYMLGNISTPPAFTSVKYLASASQPSTSVRVTTGMIRIRDVSFTGYKLDWFLGKNGHLDIVLSFGLEQNRINSSIEAENDGLISRKANSNVSRSWFYCLFLWIIVVVSLGSKMSNIVCPRSYMS